MSDLIFDDLSRHVIGAAIEVHKELGPGLLENAYQVALAYELAEKGFNVKQHVKIPLYYKGVKLDKGFEADIIVNDQLIIELKATENIHDVFYKQLWTYLKLTKIPVGLLINFNSELLKDGIRRIVNNYSTRS